MTAMTWVGCWAYNGVRRLYIRKCYDNVNSRIVQNRPAQLCNVVYEDQVQYLEEIDDVRVGQVNLHVEA